MSGVSSSPPPFRTRVGVYALAWGLSVLPLLVSGELERSLGGGSRLILAALPWIGLIGLPWSDPAESPARGQERSGRRAWGVALGLALPPLVLAGWLDLRAGLEREAVLGIAGFVAMILVLLGEASHQASRGAIRLHGFCWLAIVPGAAALAASLSWAIDGQAAADGLAAILATVSPLSTLWRDFSGEPVSLAAAVLRPACLASALLLAFTWLAGRRRGETR